MNGLFLAYIFWAMSNLITYQRSGATGTITGLVNEWRATILENIDTWLYSATNSAINSSVKIMQMQDDWGDFYPHTASNAITLTGSTAQQIWPANGSFRWARISQISLSGPPNISLVLVESTGGPQQQRTTLMALNNYCECWVARLSGGPPAPAYYVNKTITGDFQIASQSPYTTWWLEINGGGATGHTAEVSLIFWTDTP